MSTLHPHPHPTPPLPASPPPPTTDSPPPVKPRVIIHGGSGNITRATLPPTLWERYDAALRRILRSTAALLATTDALTAAVHAVSQLETDPLFNAGIGAVFTRTGRVELEASVAVSRGARKRGAAVSGLAHVRSPVALAAELLRRGARDEDARVGARGAVHVAGEGAEALASAWGLEMCEERVFWTRRRWEEHRRGLERERDGQREGEDVAGGGGGGGGLDEAAVDYWGGRGDEDGGDGDVLQHLPQGTVGCVVLDRHGTIAAASSTGGVTNKAPGRVGDTPTFGAGIWAEEWDDDDDDDDDAADCAMAGGRSSSMAYRRPAPAAQPTDAQRIADAVAHALAGIDPLGAIGQCLGMLLPPPPPHPPLYTRMRLASSCTAEKRPASNAGRQKRAHRRAVAMCGTGNGDTFVRLCALRSAAARARFSGASLEDAVVRMAGPGGELQRSAEDRWGVTGEGEGGIIGIELARGVGRIVLDFNRAMYRAWIDDEGVERCMVFRDEY